jgi:hypothetical protein
MKVYFVKIRFFTRYVNAAINFFYGEGPRSISYRRTAALRLIVQPCDEDAEKDDQFFFSLFQVMERR